MFEDLKIHTLTSISWSNLMFIFSEEDISLNQTQHTRYEQYERCLLESKNVIFRGAPGVGKSFLAKKIAAMIVSDGAEDHYANLSPAQKSQVEFVQFHPSYDYTDFVEGLRPRMNEDGSIGFELQDGIFKGFVDRARENFEIAKESRQEKAKEAFADEIIALFFENIQFEQDQFQTITGSQFTIIDVDEHYISIYIPRNPLTNRIKLNMNDIRKMLISGETFDKVTSVTRFFGKKNARQEYSYDLALFQEMSKFKSKLKKNPFVDEKIKKYVFIIDEINRGEISKIFGELFFSIDPGCRGKAGEVSTQYANMHAEPEKKFYIPPNVYIIGTMNDIDRSVDSFDFAMRRRFRFIEIRARDTQFMLEYLGDKKLVKEATERMNRLNTAILAVDGLNENYQIGAAYFLKLKEKTVGFDELWRDYLEPLLQDYVRGLYDEKAMIRQLYLAYCGDENRFGSDVIENEQ